MRLIATIAWLRLRLFLNGFNASIALNLAASLILGLLVGGLSLGIAIGWGAVVIAVFEADDDSRSLVFRMIFYLCLLVGVLLPLLLRGGVHGIDISRLRPLPVRRPTLYALVVASAFFAPEHLFYYPTLLAVAVTALILPARGVLEGLVVLFSLALCLAVWSHTIGLAVQVVLRSRRSREIVGIVVLLVLMLVSILPIGLRDRLGTHENAVRVAVGLGASKLPPGIAADAMVSLANGARGPALASVMLLLAWIAAGLGTGMLVFRRLYDGDQGGGWQRPRSTEGTRLLDFTGSLLPSSPEVAVAVKDLRYLLRSVVGRFVLVVMPLSVVVIGFGIGRRIDFTAFGIDSSSLLFLALPVYMPLAMNVFINNAFAWEGHGVQSYFLGPAPFTRILLGKNIALWAYAALVGALCSASWFLAAGTPDASILVSGVLLFSSALLTSTSAGNLISLAFPAPRGVSGMRNNLPGGSFVLSIASLILIGIQSFIGVTIPVLLGAPWLRPLFLAVLLAVLCLAYRTVLRIAAAWMEGRAERLIAALRPAADR